MNYKGFDKDLKCKGFQYEIGKEYECESAKACEKGFHACERPLDVLVYYPPATSRYCEVEQSGEMSTNSDDSKVASTKIKIGAEIGIPGLVRAQIEYTRAHTTTEHTDPGAATAGARGAATAGNWGFALSGGTSSVGEKGVAVARGDCPRAKGGAGAVLVLIKTKDSDEVEAIKEIVVDGEKIKADTWYTIKDGEIAEVDE